MTQQEAYEALRQRRNELIPEALELRFGCEVENLEEGGVEVVCHTDPDTMPKPGVYTNKTHPLYQASYRFTSGEYTDGYVYKILGTPVTLQEILRMMNVKSSGHYYAIGSDGGFVDITGEPAFLIGKNATEVNADLTKSPEEWDAEILEWILQVTNNTK